jgi:Zn-dependent protease with chaperone function
MSNAWVVIPKFHADAQPTNQALFDNISQELGMPEQVKVKKMGNYAKYWYGDKNAMAARGNYIIIGEEWFNTLSEQEKRFVAGHELIHVKNHHLYKTLAFALIIPAATAAIITNVLDKIHKKLRQKAKTTNNKFVKKLANCSDAIRMTYLKIGQFSRGWSDTAIAALYSSLLIFTYARTLEREADTESATKLNCAQGGIDFFTSVGGEQEKKLTPIQQLTTFIRTHPHHNKRIEYLEELRNTKDK